MILREPPKPTPMSLLEMALCTALCLGVFCMFWLELTK